MSTVGGLPSTRPGGWDDPAAEPVPAPLALYEVTVGPPWVDYNGHMSEWCYLLVMGDSSDAFFRYVGIDDDYRAAGHSLYTVETHIRNLHEVDEGDRLRLTLQVLGVDPKRVHILHEMLAPRPATPGQRPRWSPQVSSSCCTSTPASAGSRRCRRSCWTGSDSSPPRTRPCPSRPGSGSRWA